MRHFIMYFPEGAVYTTICLWKKGFTIEDQLHSAKFTWKHRPNNQKSVRELSPKMSSPAEHVLKITSGSQSDCQNLPLASSSPCLHYSIILGPRCSCLPGWVMLPSKLSKAPDMFPAMVHSPCAAPTLLAAHQSPLQPQQGIHKCRFKARSHVPAVTAFTTQCCHTSTGLTFT